MALTVSTKDLAEAIGVPVRTINKFRRDGLAIDRKDGKTQFYDIRAVCDWLLQTGRHKYYAKLMAHADKAKADEPIIIGPVDNDIERMAERMRKEEAHCYAMVEQARNTDSYAYALERYRDISEQRRKIEKDLAIIRLSQGDVVPVSQVNEAWARVSLAVRNDLMSLSTALAPRLVNIHDPAEAEKIVEEAVRDCVRHITDKHAGV